MSNDFPCKSKGCSGSCDEENSYCKNCVDDKVYAKNDDSPEDRIGEIYYKQQMEEVRK